MRQKNIDRNILSQRLAYRDNLNISGNQAYQFIGVLLKELTNALQSGQNIKLPIFGVFSTISKNERIGRNPLTKQEAVISARRVVKFKYSRPIRDRINSSIKAKKGA